MGNCLTSEMKASPKKHEAVRHTEPIKLLLLGAGESGKSTVYKQLNYLYGSGYTEEERIDIIPGIHQNIIECIQELLKQEILYQETLSLLFTEEHVKEREFLLGISVREPMTQSLASKIAALWDSLTVQATYVRRHEFHLLDCAAHFLSKVRETAEASYVPSDEDVLKSRVRTTGILKIEFTAVVPFVVYDLGGQRNERKKWKKCFENVTTLIFVASLSGFNNSLYEDPSVNRLREALDLFEQICSNHYFENTQIALFLNKTDLFEKSFSPDALRENFPDFSGESVQDAHVFIRCAFEERHKESTNTKAMSTYFTTATEVLSVMSAFEEIRDDLAEQRMARMI